MLKCVMHPGCGRLVVAARDIKAGEIVFTEEAYAVAPNVDHSKKRFCIFCAGPITQTSHHCGLCNSLYCSEVCHNQHERAHTESGECAALLFCQILRPKIDNEDLDTFQLASLVITRCVVEGNASLLKREPVNVDKYGAENSEVETVGLGQERATPLDFLREDTVMNPRHVRKSTYLHFEALVTNVHNIRPDVVSDFHCLYDIYHQGVTSRKVMRKLHSMKHFLSVDVSKATYVSICCAFLCNGFGIRDSQNRKQATAVFTDSSYFNHSCAPNLGRRNLKHSRVMEFFTTRPIAEGGQLCISYVDVKLPASERLAKLNGTYAFTCQCLRCRTDADHLLANTTIGDAVPPMCEFCTSRILQPLPGGSYMCPCCEKEQKPQ